MPWGNCAFAFRFNLLLSNCVWFGGFKSVWFLSTQSSKQNEGSSVQILQNSLWRCSQQIFCWRSYQYLQWLACNSQL